MSLILYNSLPKKSDEGQSFHPATGNISTNASQISLNLILFHKTENITLKKSEFAGDSSAEHEYTFGVFSWSISAILNGDILRGNQSFQFCCWLLFFGCKPKETKGILLTTLHHLHRVWVRITFSILLGMNYNLDKRSTAF